MTEPAEYDTARAVRQRDDEEYDRSLATLEERLDALLAQPTVQFSSEEQSQIEEARAKADVITAKGTTERILVRSAWARRKSLFNALLPLLKKNDIPAREEEARCIVLKLENAAAIAHASGRWRQDRYATDFRDAYRENSIRTALFSDGFNRLRKKVGREAAALKASKFWEAPLTRAQRSIPVRFRVASWEAIVGDALIQELATALGRSLKISTDARSGRFSGPDLRALCEAMRLARSMPGAPQEKRRGKGVQTPGTEHWFANRLRQHRKVCS